MAILSKTFQSSNLDHAKYDETNSMLTIVFKNGGEYNYSDVPMDVWQGLTQASSAGSYFHGNIRSAFAYERVG